MAVLLVTKPGLTAAVFSPFSSPNSLAEFYTPFTLQIAERAYTSLVDKRINTKLSGGSIVEKFSFCGGVGGFEPPVSVKLDGSRFQPTVLSRRNLGVTPWAV
jgi:hypothetical protein